MVGTMQQFDLSDGLAAGLIPSSEFSSGAAYNTVTPSRVNYSYDARGYRISESYPQGGTGIPAGTTNYLYYSTQEQVLEQRWNGMASSDVQYQYVWSNAYVDAMVLRDTYSGGTLQANDCIYTTYDTNYDATSLIGYNATTQTWGVTERFVYSPYDTAAVLDANWNATTNAYSWQYMYKVGRQDPITGLYHFDHRDYSTSLGTWISQDPMQYFNGANTYQFVVSNPVGRVDTIGLAETWKSLGRIKVMEMTWTIDESVEGNGIWGVLFPMHVHQKVDFEVLVKSSITLEISVIGPMGPEGEPDEGTLLPPIQLTGSEYWSLPWASMLRPNRARLAGLPCRKGIYFVQTGKNCEGKVETFYVHQPDIVGSGSLTLGNLGFDSAKAEQEVLQQAANPNLNICGEGTTDKPSGLAPLDSTAAIWAYYQPD